MTKAEEQKHTKRTDQSESLADLLRVAKPRLILRVTPDPYNELKYTVVPTVREAERETQEVIDEGYDPDHSPLGRPVYWRIVTRGGQKLYCSTFRTSHDQIIQAWGTPGLAYCDGAGTAVAQIETILEANAHYGRNTVLCDGR
jgi:hypothetical protein